MHQYLKAIGFNNIHTRKDLKKLLSETEENFTHQTVVSYRQGEDFCEFQKEYGQGIGISVCGELTEDEKFERAYYFPYFTGSGITTYADITVERKIEKEQYVGLCEDAKVGISLIFTIQNGIEYMRERKAGFVEGVQTSVTFSGLALSGMILLPVVKNEQQIQWHDLWQYEDIQVLFFLTFKKSHETDIQLSGQKKRILVVHAQFHRINMYLRIKLMKFRIDI